VEVGTGVLVLGDDANVRTSLARVAKTVGCRVWEAGDIETAKALLTDETGIRGLSIDVGVSGERGLDFLWWAREDFGCDLPALVMAESRRHELGANPAKMRAAFVEKRECSFAVERFFLAAKHAVAIRDDVASFCARYGLGAEAQRLLEFAWYMDRADLFEAMTSGQSKTDKLSSSICQKLMLARLDQYFRHHALLLYRQMDRDEG